MDGNYENTTGGIGTEAPSAAANETTVDAPVVEKVTMDTPVAEQPAMVVQSAEDYFSSAFMSAPPTPEADASAQGGTQSGGWQPYGATNTAGTSAQGGTQSGGWQPYGATNTAGTSTQSGTQNGVWQPYATDTTAQGGAGFNNTWQPNSANSPAPQGNGGVYDYYGANNYGQNAGYTYGGANDEYSQPNFGYQSGYASDPFTSYYDEEEIPRKSNGLAIASLVCGIVSLATMCSYLGFVPGIVAIILGARGTKESGNPRMATIGLILGICGTVAGLIFFFSMFARIAAEIADYF